MEVDCLNCIRTEEYVRRKGLANCSTGIHLLDDLEEAGGYSTREAAAVLGLTYPRYMEFKRGTRILKKYHIASITAHLKLLVCGNA